uniref:Small ribosomal subunit protein uS17 n=1 Tax=Hippocampus comes TaxID=109280 RepID=A0A3Q2Z2H0_HIPCM
PLYTIFNPPLPHDGARVGSLWQVLFKYLAFLFKYNRFEKRHKNLSAHLSPCFRDVSIGDIVTVGECRPLSKTVRFNVLKVTTAAGHKKQFRKF